MSGLPEGVTRGPWYVHKANDSFWQVSTHEDAESTEWCFFALFHKQADAEYVCELINNHM